MKKYISGDDILIHTKILTVEGDGSYAVENKHHGAVYVEESEIFEPADITAEETWDLAKSLFSGTQHGGYDYGELIEIFGRTDHLWELTPQQVKEKIEAWESKEAIHLGDEVKSKIHPGFRNYDFVVTAINENGTISGYSPIDGHVVADVPVKGYRKTGRHINIENLFFT